MCFHSGPWKCVDETPGCATRVHIPTFRFFEGGAGRDKSGFLFQKDLDAQQRHGRLPAFTYQEAFP